MQTLDYKQSQNAIDAVRLLYTLGLIDVFIYEALTAKVRENTGE